MLTLTLAILFINYAITLHRFRGAQ